MNIVTCPICNGQTFKKSTRHRYHVCLTCGSVERTRMMYLTMIKLGIPRTNDRILHFAPEKSFINLFSESHGEKYQACDLFPEQSRYKNSKKVVRRLDICEDLYSMPSDEWNLILHNHVLEHLFCSVKGVLCGFDRILKPGGAMLWTIPVKSKLRTTENLNPDLSDEERVKKFGQKNHVRRFGGDVLDLIEQALGVDCFVPVKSLFTEKELKMAGIQWKPEKKPDGDSIFLYRKNYGNNSSREE